MTPSVPGRLFRGYGPLVGFAAMFLAIALLVPTQAQEIRTEPATDSSALVAGSATGEAPASSSLDGQAPDNPLTPPDGAPATNQGAGGPAVAGRTTVRDTAQKAGAGGQPAVGQAPAAGGRPAVAACPGRAKQDPNDPYSPPCYTFAGSNGGATSRGVTADSVTISVRIQGFDNGTLDALSRVAKANIPNEPRSKIEATIVGLVDYLNRSYEFYGRKLAIKVFTGQGEIERELLGSGQEGAQADALRVTDELVAFADASGVSPPYADALAKRGVVSSGAPYVSRQWLSSRRPYVWSQFTDCSTVVEASASYYLSKMAGKPAAYAGGSLAGQPRRAAILAPDNSWYQECASSGAKALNDAGRGAELILNEPYRLDINSMAPQATSLIAKLKSNAITTVICGCDPLILTFLTGKAREQNYEPEWLETGVALTDQDLIGQIMDQGTWRRAFGVSFAGPTEPQQGTTGYRAFKAVRPGQEPSFGVDLIFRQLQLLALGIQMAGPNLTPETFEQGMFRFPIATGPAGTWKFGPNDYTTSQDAREIYWSPDARSPQNDRPGAWIDPNNGARWPIGGFPAGEPNVPR